MRPPNWRPVTIVLLGLLTLFGVPVTRTLFGQSVPELGLQVLAVSAALFLLWQEVRKRRPAARWRRVAWLGGVLVFLWIAGIALLWVIWPK